MEMKNTCDAGYFASSFKEKDVNNLQYSQATAHTSCNIDNAVYFFLWGAVLSMPYDSYTFELFCTKSY